MSSFINWKKDLSPFHNQEIIWFYIFLPSIILFFRYLADYVNEKPAIGAIVSLHPSFDKLIYPKHGMEIIADGMIWSEGPYWVETDSLNYLVYSDTRQNVIYRWDEGKGFFTVGKTLMMRNSGCYTNTTYCNTMFEVGSNGISRMPPTKENPGAVNFVVCQHGERAISILYENGTNRALATNFKGRRLNSPNDLVWSPDGNLYFTDPKYGLVINENESIEPEIPVSGIYMIRKEDIKSSLQSLQPAKVQLLRGDLAFANGLAFSPDYSKLYVSNSDPENPIIKSYDVNDDGTLAKGKVFFNATELLLQEKFGLPDGLKVDIHGNLFSTGPGGVMVISSEGELIGQLKLDRPVSNVLFGGDGRLYLTASDLLVRMWIKTKPSRILKLRW